MSNKEQFEGYLDAVYEREKWQSLAAALYQACGAYDMPERVLDVLSAAQCGEPFEHMIDGILPCHPEPQPARVPDGFMKWLEAMDIVAGLSGLDDDEIIPTWPSQHIRDKDFFADYPQLTVGLVRESHSILAASPAPEVE